MKHHLFFLFLICFLLTQCGKHNESNCVPKGLILSNPKFINTNDTSFYDYRLQELLQDTLWSIVYDVKNATCDSILIYSNKFKHTYPGRIDYFEKNGENGGALIDSGIRNDQMRIGLAPGEVVKMNFDLDGDTAISRFDSLIFHLPGTTVEGRIIYLVAKWENTD